MRKTGALSFLLFTSAGLSTGSTISGAKFVNAKPVYFPKFDTRFDNDNRGGNAYRTLSFHDLDGSVSGIPDSHVLLHDGENDSVATDDTCEIHPTWNASVCKGDIGRLNLSDARGEFPAAVDLESRTARFALISSIGANAPDTPLVKAQRAALFSRRAPQAPIALVRNGKEFKISGDQSTVKAGTEIQVKTERPEVTLSLAEMDQGSWVMFELPGFANAASGNGKEQHGRIARSERDLLFQGPECPLGQIGGRASGQAGNSSNGSASQHNGQPLVQGHQPSTWENHQVLD